MAQVEVERKYRIKRRQINKIVQRLFDMLFTATPFLQEDRYLKAAKGITERVRRQETYNTVENLHTKKRKIQQKDSPNTNEEDENEITSTQHAGFVRRRQDFAHGAPLVVRKTPRIDFRGKFGGMDVSVCIDLVKGPDGIKFGYFVELEAMVGSYLEIQGAQRVLKTLRQEVLPKSAKREMRGYRNMLLRELERRAKCEQKKNKGDKKKAR